jgi:hypothetical protein
MKKFILSFLFSVTICPFLSAQNYFSASQEEFGKNRIQYKNFEWKTVRSNNFELNYYRGGNELAERAAKIAEGEFDRITEVLGYTPFTMMKIFIYNSPKDLTQSNIGLTSPIDYDGGILNLSRSRVEISYAGNEDDFKADIVQQVAKLFVYDMLYGGSLKEVLQSSLMLTVPDWYMSGVARYVSHDNSSEEELSLMKAKVMQAQNKKLKILKGDDAAIVGQSIWHYIAERYGIDNISNILNLTRIIRDEQSSITSTLGISYNRFLREWREYYSNDRHLRGTVNGDKNIAEKVEQSPEVPISEVTQLPNLKLNEIDTDNYSFEPKNIDKVKAETSTGSKSVRRSKTLTRANRIREEFKLTPPKAYQNLLVTNDIKTEFLSDPVRRLGMQNTLMMNDMLENNVFEFGLFIAPSFRNHDITVKYKNNINRVDWGLSFERRSIFLESAEERNHFLFRPLGLSLPEDANFAILRRVFYHRAEGTVSYPLSNNLRVSGSPFLVNTTDVDYRDIGRENLNRYYTGAVGEIVFDKSNKPFPNVEVGTKALIRYEKYVGLNNERGFNRLTIDARHYQPVVKGVVLAARFSYGTSTGNAPKTTFIGGSENWVNRQVYATNGQANGVPGDLSDIAFYNFAGSLRGFNFARIYGNNHLLTNVEIRLSIADFVSNGALASNALKSLQFIAFNDIGTAWQGANGPFSRQNSLNTELVGGGNNPFRANVTNFKNPFLMGNGFGARTSILGYFVRADYAWGFEDKEINKPILHISIGHDF